MAGQQTRREKTALVQFDPLWPKLYAENVLFRNVKKIVLVSATVRPKTAIRLFRFPAVLQPLS